MATAPAAAEHVAGALRIPSYDDLVALATLAAAGKCRQGRGSGVHTGDAASARTCARQSRLARERWEQQERFPVQLSGLEACRPLLGADWTGE